MAKTKKPRIVKMTAKKHAELVAGGCDPHCHVCHQPIAIGERWAIKLFVSHYTSPTLSMHALFDVETNIRAGTCEACIVADRGLPPEEFVEFERRMAAWAERVAIAGVPVAQRPPSQVVPPSGRGCFIAPDGSIL